MSGPITVPLPDIGDFTDVEVIEIHVAVGDTVARDESLITLESDKATMDVPSPESGEVTEILVSLGDKISEGDPILKLKGASTADAATQPDSALGTSGAESSKPKPPAEVKPGETAAGTNEPITVQLPDIGDFSDVEVIEVHVAAGDAIAKDDSLITLESDKATMDVPSPESGEVTEVLVSLGDKISEGDPILKLKGASTADAEPTSAPAPQTAAPSAPKPTKESEQHESTADDVPSPRIGSDPFAPKRPPVLPPPVERAKGTLPHASPSVRRFARELGADLSKVRGSGAKGRITKEDVKKFVKQTLQEGPALTSGAIVGPPPIPEVDFSQFGDTESVKLSKIKRITGDRLHRSWLDIPHVTHHDEADISELELFRKAIDAEEKISGTRVTILAFICKAIINALQQYPNFNASLSPDRQSLILKKYFNIGVAVDTPNGLVVPVIRNIQSLGVLEIAKTLQALGEKARVGNLTPSDFQGGCFTISSLGGIGGRFFTPIINPPEVAILGVSRNHLVAFPGEDGVEWKTMLPLSLSYDHRVIDGAEAARFVKFVCELLYDARRILL